ncbi:MAG: gliding motility protein GldL [Bacteroidaceae bacterium]|nr:gliding motility protein GldL [Bacteroidaceae bacterium]
MAKQQYNAIQRFLRTKAGQTALNYAYSWGASVVILGALFKITHMEGADIMLFLGMGTEVVVFFLAGFEPQESMDQRELAEEEIENAQIRASVNAGYVAGGTPLSEETAAALAAASKNGGIGGGGTVVVGGSTGSGPVVIGGGGGAGISEETAAALANAAASLGNVSHVGGGAAQQSGEAASASQEPTPVKIVNAAELAENISAAPVFNSAQYYGMTPEMQEATRNYVSQLTELTQTLMEVAEQSKRLTRDSEEMENMNRTLTGINRFYEMQLKSVGTQSATIDEVNEQTKKLASQLAELNEVYAKMVEALRMKIS